MKDFADEIEVYQNTRPIVELLNTMKLRGSASKQIEQVYINLYKNKFVTADEVKFIKAWLQDIA